MPPSIPKIMDIINILSTEEECITFLLENEILYSSAICSYCGCTRKRNNLRFRCTKDGCRKSVSIFKDSFFAGSRLNCNEVLHIGYLWLTNCSRKSIIFQTGHSPNTITDYMGYFRDLVTEALESDDVIVGGEGIVVQVDETKIGKRKYNRGHRVDGAWVIVGVEKTVERLVFAEVVQDRSAKTIENVLSRHVAAGSIIQTDCWRGYSKIAEKFGVVHQTVNHSNFFVDPITGIDTNTVEGTNFAIKSSIPIRNRTEEFIQSFLLEFVWRRKNIDRLWDAFLVALKSVLY